MTAKGKNAPIKTNIILLANQPRMMREMLHRVLKRYPQTHYVFEYENGEDLPELLDSIHAQWLVVSLEEGGNLPQGVERVMLEHPDLDVLAVSEDGDYLEIIRASDSSPHERVALRDISLHQLLDLFSVS